MSTSTQLPSIDQLNYSRIEDQLCVFIILNSEILKINHSRAILGLGLKSNQTLTVHNFPSHHHLPRCSTACHLAILSLPHRLYRRASHRVAASNGLGHPTDGVYRRTGAKYDSHYNADDRVNDDSISDTMLETRMPQKSHKNARCVDRARPDSVRSHLTT